MTRLGLTYWIFKYINFKTFFKNGTIWVFGEISNGVLAEIKITKEMDKPIRYFTVIDSKEIKEISKEEVELEEEIGDTSRDEL